MTKAVVAEEFRDDVATWHAGNVVRCVAGLVAWVVYCVYVTNR